jgi:hypothetical protein
MLEGLFGGLFCFIVRLVSGEFARPKIICYCSFEVFYIRLGYIYYIKQPIVRGIRVYCFFKAK